MNSNREQEKGLFFQLAKYDLYSVYFFKSVLTLLLRKKCFMLDSYNLKVWKELADGKHEKKHTHGDFFCCSCNCSFAIIFYSPSVFRRAWVNS